MDPGRAGPRKPIASIIFAMASAMAARGAALTSSAATGTVPASNASNASNARAGPEARVMGWFSREMYK